METLRKGSRSLGGSDSLWRHRGFKPLCGIEGDLGAGDRNVPFDTHGSMFAVFGVVSAKR